MTGNVTTNKLHRLALAFAYYVACRPVIGYSDSYPFR